MLGRSHAAHDRKAALIAAVFALGACSHVLPRPPFVAQPTSALFIVATAPPPARAELVPGKPASHAVWLDGEWEWQGRKWAWKRGRWVLPPEGARYSPWTMTRDETGALWFAPGVWRNASGEEVDEPDALAFGRTSLGDVTSPSGEKENVGRTLREAEPR
jgi:hypothetical protein